MKKTALVTGAGRGLGAVLAERLALAGYAVGVHYRSSEEQAKNVVSAIRARGGEAAVFQANLAQEGQALRVVGEVTAAFGGLDVLINNAGVYHGRNLQQLSERDWNEGLHSTASATFFITRAALPCLRQSGQGRIINVGDSSCGRTGARDLSMSYHIGKTGVLMLTRSFAREEARHGITVNMVSPGYLENSLELPSPSSIPAGRFGTFDDIWNAVEFFLKPESSYVNGSNVVVSGGWNLL